MTPVTDTSEAGPLVVSGQIMAMRLFDVAYAIDLARAEALWTRHIAGGASRTKLAVTPPKAMALGVPPLSIALEPVSLLIDGVAVAATITAQLYESGALTLGLRVRATGYSGRITPTGSMPWTAAWRARTARRCGARLWTPFGASSARHWSGRRLWN